MANVDLKLTGEDALRQLGRDVDHAIERIRARAEELAQQLRDAGVTHEHHGELVLSCCGNYWGRAAMANPIERGAYRALVLITKRPE